MFPKRRSLRPGNGFRMGYEGFNYDVIVKTIKNKVGIKRNSGRLHSVKIRKYMENGNSNLGLAIVIETTRHAIE